jgi:hypothetical protein
VGITWRTHQVTAADWWRGFGGRSNLQPLTIDAFGLTEPGELILEDNSADVRTGIRLPRTEPVERENQALEAR